MLIVTDNGGQMRAAALTAWHVMRCGLDGTTPDLDPDPRTVQQAAGFAAGQALIWIRDWHRLALACDLTEEKIAEINAAEPVVTMADTLTRQFINGQIAALLQPGDPAAAQPQPEPAQQPAVNEAARDDLDTRGRSPQFKLACWDFLAAFQDGTAAPPEDHHVALWLAGAFSRLWVRYLMLHKGVSEAEAEAAYSEMVDGQRAIYGSLASMEQEAPGTAAS